MGPRILANDYGITITGGHASALKIVRALAFDRDVGLIEENKGIVDGPTECMKAVRQQLMVGADQIARVPRT